MADKTRTVEVQGIEVSIDMRRLEDARFAFAIGKATDPKVADEKKLVWYTRMMDLLFDDAAYDIMCDLADAGDGTVDSGTFNDFFSEVLEAVDAKN